MNPIIYEVFERICLERGVGGPVLEIGAIPNKKSLLSMKALKNVTNKTGISLNGPYEFDGYTIHKGNANSMNCFGNESFNAVLCNATLEHDKFFWKTIGEIQRVTAPGGLVVIGVPGYKYLKVEKMKSILKKYPMIRNLGRTRFLNLFFSSTITFQMHNAPGDYYRFSEQALKEVIFEDMENVEICSVMVPPRIIGVGTKRKNDPLG